MRRSGAESVGDEVAACGDDAEDWYYCWVLFLLNRETCQEA